MAQTTTEKKSPEFGSGDTVRVHVRVVEGESERIQVFEGMVIRRKGSGISETFTVRKNSFGVGVERTFPVQSPRIDKIEVAKSGKVRRAKLYYMRGLSGKAARLEEHEEKAAAAPAAASPAEKPEAPKKEAAPAGPVSAQAV